MSITNNLLVRVAPAVGDTQIKNIVNDAVFTGSGTPTLIDEGSEKAWQILTGTELRSAAVKSMNGSADGTGFSIALRFKRTANGSTSFQPFTGLTFSGQVLANAAQIGTNGNNSYRGQITASLSNAPTATDKGLNTVHTLVYVCRNFAASNSDTGSIWSNKTNRTDNNPDFIRTGGTVGSINYTDAYISCASDAAYNLLDFIVWGRELTDAEAAAVADDIRGTLNAAPPTPTPITFTGTIPQLNGVRNTAVNFNFGSYFTGTRTPFTYSIASGTLPAGLSISGSSIVGTPTASGNATISIRGTDSASGTATSNTFTIAIADSPIPITFNGTIAPITTIVGNPVNIDIASFFGGNQTPFTFAIATGSLPAGLTLSGSIISGTPTAVANTTLTIRGTDRNGATAVSNSISVSVSATATPVTFTGTIGSVSGTRNLPLPSVNITGFFWGTMTPFTFTISSGSLPAGVSLVNGVLQGTPTVTGTFNVRVRATDSGSNSAESNQFSIVIGEPAAGTTLISRSNLTPTSVTISANYSGTDNSGFEYSLNDGLWVVMPVSPFTIEGLTPYTDYSVVVRPKVVGDTGTPSNRIQFKTYRGVLASQVPSTGASGPSCIFNDIARHSTLQNDYVYCNFLTEPMGGNGVFASNPDGSFSWVGAADGTYTFTYQYEVNNINIGPIKNVKLVIG